MSDRTPRIPTELTRLLDAVSEGVSAVDPDGRHTYVNQAFAEMTGFTKEELYAAGLPHPYWPKEQLPVVESAYQETMESAGSRTFELEFQRKNGERFPVHISTGTVDTPDGTVAIATVQDLSLQREMNRELTQAREWMEVAIRGGSLAMWEWHLTEGWARVSDSYYTIIGYEPGDWPASYEEWAKRVHPEDIAAADASMHAVVSGATTVYAADHRMLRADGEWEWLSAIGYVVESMPDGQPVRILGTQRSIQEEKLKEQRLQEVQRTQLVDQLTIGLTHDFNNILLILGGYLELLDEEIDAAEVREEMRAALKRGGALTRSLLDYARRAPATTDRVDLRALLEESSTLLQSALPGHLRLRVEVPDTAPLQVDVGRDRLENSLLNLIVNARDAMDGRKGEIQLRLRLTELGDADDRRAAVAIEVRDQGVGIPTELVEQVTEPLFTTKPPGKGTGLGLSMAKKLVEESNGALEIESEPEVGTTIRLVFPIVAGADVDDYEADAPEVRRVAGGPSLRILVVDDETEIKRMVERMLARAGHVTASADDPRNALRILREEGPFDLLLTDVSMPYTIDGPELARRALALDPRLAVVFMTGFMDSEQAASARALGPVMEKPFRTAEMLDLIAEAAPRAG